ncbi:MAG: hypothetical protein WA728_21350 [Xanthobacteraceae bacterium]
MDAADKGDISQHMLSKAMDHCCLTYFSNDRKAMLASSAGAEFMRPARLSSASEQAALHKREANSADHLVMDDVGQGADLDGLTPEEMNAMCGLAMMNGMSRDEFYSKLYENEIERKPNVYTHLNTR